MRYRLSCLTLLLLLAGPAGTTTGSRDHTAPAPGHPSATACGQATSPVDQREELVMLRGRVDAISAELAALQLEVALLRTQAR